MRQQGSWNGYGDCIGIAISLGLSFALPSIIGVEETGLNCIVMVTKGAIMVL